MVAPLFFESYIITSLCFHRMAIGFILAYPAILNTVLTSNNTDIQVTSDEASSIIASYSVTGLLGFLIVPTLCDMYGRRVANVLMNMIIVIGSIIIATASGVPGLIAGRSFQGIGFCGLFLNTVISSEYVHPKRRGSVIVFQGVAILGGIFLCHSLIYTLTWREMAWLGAVPAAIGAISTVFWLESPSWLAYKGRFEDCAKTFDLLRGKNSESKIEINELISAQKEFQKLHVVKENILLRTMKILRCSEFLKPFIIMTLLTTLSHASGIYYILTYILDIMQELTEDKTKSFYYVLGSDAFKLVSIFVSTLNMKWFDRRTILFYFGSFSCFLMGFVCVFDYLEQIDILHMRWLTPSILIVYSFVSQIGIYDIYIVYIGEIIPLQYKGIGSCIMGIMYSALGVITLKYTSIMLINLKVYGTFCLYLAVSVGCMICLHFVLPETKNKTLQSIENNFFNVIDKNDESGQEMIAKENQSRSHAK